MNDISAWDYDYLPFTSNPSAITAFLEEKDDVALLRKANKLLSNSSNIISFGFVAGRCIALNSSSRNPLFPLWPKLRLSALAILQNPPMKDPLDYLFMDYKIALWILSITALPQDLPLCLDLYKNYASQHLMLKSAIKSTIYDLVETVQFLNEETQQQYKQFLKKEITLHPNNNLRDIKGLLTFAPKADWEHYLQAIQSGAVENDKLGTSTLLYLLQSSNAEVRKEVYYLIEEFSAGKQTSNTLYFFYQKATTYEINSFDQAINAYKALQLSIKQRDEQQFKHLLSSNWILLKNVLLTPSTYQEYSQKSTYFALKHLATYLFEHAPSVSLYLGYCWLLKVLSTTDRHHELNKLMTEQLMAIEPWINQYYGEQRFILNVNDFKQIL